MKIQNTKEAAMALKQKTERELMERYGLKTYKDLKREGYQNVGRSKNILWARDSKQIREIGRDLIKYARYIGKDKGKVGGNVDTYLTKDKKIKINLRDESKSGGKTTELMFHEKENIKTKIHSIEYLRNLKK